MLGKQFYETTVLRLVFRVRFRVSDSVSFVMNLMFEIASCDVLLALSLHTP